MNPISQDPKPIQKPPLRKSGTPLTNLYEKPKSKKRLLNSLYGGQSQK